MWAILGGLWRLFAAVVGMAGLLAFWFGLFVLIGYLILLACRWIPLVGRHGRARSNEKR